MKILSNLFDFRTVKLKEMPQGGLIIILTKAIYHFIDARKLALRIYMLTCLRVYRIFKKKWAFIISGITYTALSSPNLKSLIHTRIITEITRLGTESVDEPGKSPQVVMTVIRSTKLISFIYFHY